MHGNFSDIKGIIKDERADGILFDLGVSSYQLEDKAREIFFMSDAPLDMRMDKKAEITAADIINRSSERELSDIIFKYGEERFAKRIASLIVMEREKKTDSNDSTAFRYSDKRRFQHDFVREYSSGNKNLSGAKD